MSLRAAGSVALSAVNKAAPAALGRAFERVPRPPPAPRPTRQAAPPRADAESFLCDQIFLRYAAGASHISARRGRKGHDTKQPKNALALSRLLAFRPLAPFADSPRVLAALAGATGLAVRALLQASAAGADTWSRRERGARGCDDGTYDAVLAYPD